MRINKLLLDKRVSGQRNIVTFTQNFNHMLCCVLTLQPISNKILRMLLFCVLCNYMLENKFTNAGSTLHKRHYTITTDVCVHVYLCVSGHW